MAVDTGAAAGDAVGLGISALTGNPVGIALSLAGLGMQIFGGLGQANVSKQTAALSAGVAADEQAVNQQKYQQMLLESNRASLQNYRKVQQAKALSLSVATNQGAQFGSGLKGAQAAETDQGLFNALGINQNLQIGKNIFGLESDISSKRIQLAQLGSQAATDQGFASLGNALVTAGPTIGAFVKNKGF